MANTTTTEKEVKEVKEKTVKIRIPKERGEPDDFFVAVNGRTWLIKRGVEVDVPECVAEAIRNAEDVAEQAYAFNESVKK
jgi:hypothetical protein